MFELVHFDRRFFGEERVSNNTSEHIVKEVMKGPMPRVFNHANIF